MTVLYRCAYLDNFKIAHHNNESFVSLQTIHACRFQTSRTDRLHLERRAERKRERKRERERERERETVRQ